ncbi:DUF4097 family beta strand repeat-containing protein [Nocardiopsis lucentensis]|uniref:DUF4097 family beta strand repeat-containing protein n=1 Tax=Nocardiopsis lucentensis TaxID=53441 RepID=UPI000346BB25|nr:DUF4097 family beta strand repeat-containing protein [Nocardiopsis lucentensis]
MTFKARGLYASSSKEPGGFRAGPWMLLGAVLVVVLIGVTVVSVLGNVAVDRDSRRDSFPGVASLEVDNETDGEVVLVGTDGNEVTVDRSLRGGPLKAPHEEIDAGGGEELSLNAECEGVPFLGMCEVNYEIAVPEGTLVDVETTSGRIRVDNVNGALDLSSTSGAVMVSDNVGDVSVSSTAGGVELSGVEGSVAVETVSGGIAASGSGESLDVESVSGAVDVSGFTARVVEAEATSGAVVVGGGFTSAEVSTTSGGVEVSTDVPFELLSVDSTSGSVRLRVPEGSYAVTGESGTGGRDIGVDTSSDAGARIEVNTGSGSVEVRES